MKEHPSDLEALHGVLLDLMMPEVTGFDVVEALRADAATRGSVGATDVIGLLKQVVGRRNGLR